MLALLAVAVGGYFYVTDEHRLRRYAEQWLHDFTGGEAHIRQAEFSLSTGLTLRGVTIATPESAAFDPRDNSLTGRTIFQARGLSLRLRPLGIITGGPVVPEIIATDPEVTLIHRLTDDARNWQVLLAQRPRRRSRRPLRLPTIRLRNLRLVQQRLDENGRSAGSAQSLWVDAGPISDPGDTYDVKIVRIFDPDSTGQVATEDGRLEFNVRTLAVAGSVPSMSVDDLATCAPAHIVHALDTLGLHGLVRAESIKFDPDTGGQATLSLRDASLSVPIDDIEEPLPADQRYLQFGDVAGTLSVRYGLATLDVSGRFRDARMTLKGTVTFGGEGFSMEDLGLDATVTLTGVLLPTNDDQTPPPERRFAQRWFRLREFISDYDPRGRADFTLHFRKMPGKDKGIRFVDGTLTARGPSARYFRFPYRLYNLTGDIHFRPDGRIELRDFTGTHGRCRTVINGLVDGYVSQGLDVNIKSHSINLDDDLVRCLDERDRKLVRMFNVAANMNLDVQLHRDPKPHGLPVSENPWKALVDVDFLDGTIKFEDLPYPLSGLAGHMRIQGGGFELDKLHASRGPAQVEVSGQVQRSQDGAADLNLKLDARAVPVDYLLRDALSGQAQLLFDRIAPRGRMDVAGRIGASPAPNRIGYQLVVSLKDGELNVPETQARLTAVQGRLNLSPDQLTVESLAGRLGDSPVTISGRIGVRPDAGDMSVHLASDRLMLDDKLRAALPDAVVPIWQAVHPAGPIRLDLTCERAAKTAAEASPPIRYRAVIEPMDCTAQLEEFPLPLTSVNGRFVMTPGQVTFEKVSARHEGMTFDLSGRMEMQPPRLSGQMALDIRGITFTEPLRKAVPWRMRRLWNDVKPAGKANVSLSRLTFSEGPEGNRWEAEGVADLDHLSLQIGSALRDLTGHASGRGGIGETVFVDLDLALAQARVDGRLLSDARMHMSRPSGDPRLSVQNFQGRFYGGTVIGDLEVNYATGRPAFGLSLNAREVSLEQFLNDAHASDEPPVTTKGSIDATLALAARFGDPTSRRGQGAVFIHQAHMAKIPMVLSIFNLVRGVHDDNAFDDARFAYAVDGEDLLLQEIDLRGKTLSMVGAGRVHVPTETMDLTLLVGSPLHLPRIEVLSELVEGVARELLEVHVEGSLQQPKLRAEMVKSVKKALDAVLSARRKPARR